MVFNKKTKLIEINEIDSHQSTSTKVINCSFYKYICWLVQTIDVVQIKSLYIKSFIFLCFCSDNTMADLRELHVTIEECFCNSDSDYLSCLVSLFSRNPNRLHYESNFLNDMNFLQSTNFLRIWGCNLSVPLVTSADMTSGAPRRNNTVEEGKHPSTGQGGSPH